MTKAPLAQETVGRNPTDRGKNGSKRHVLVDERGVPLSIVVTGANRHDVSQLELVLDEIVIARPNSEQNLCADKGYAGEPAQKAIKDREERRSVIQVSPMGCRGYSLLVQQIQKATGEIRKAHRHA